MGTSSLGLCLAEHRCAVFLQTQSLKDQLRNHIHNYLTISREVGGYVLCGLGVWCLVGKWRQLQRLDRTWYITHRHVRPVFPSFEHRMHITWWNISMHSVHDNCMWIGGLPREAAATFGLR